MAIIFPPKPLPLRNIKWRCPFPAQENESGWTGTGKIVGLPGAQKWSATGEFVTIIGEDRGKPWRGFFMSLMGPVHSFPVYAGEQIQTVVANPTVAAGAGNANTLPLQGLPANTAVLVAGDFMTVFLPSGYRRLVCLTSPLTSDADGKAVAVFQPELGETPAAGAMVGIQRPYALMRQTSEPPGWDVSPGQMYGFMLTAKEAR